MLSPRGGGGCLAGGHPVGCEKSGSTLGARRQRGLAGTREAEPGIDFPSIPRNHILQRLLSYISIPHLRLGL